MIAFHGRQEIKDKYLVRVRAHRLADEIVKGKYWEEGKGCAVGCTIHSDNHSAYEDELGIPRNIAYLEDRIFQNLPNELAMTWPERFLEVIPVGKDLSMVWPKFALWLLVNPGCGVFQFAESEESKATIQNVATLFERVIRGESVSRDEWQAAAAAAYSTGAACAYADDAAYAASTPEATPYTSTPAAYSTGADVITYTALATSAGALRLKLRIAQAEKLLKLLKEEK